jgi:hypothetical protein
MGAKGCYRTVHSDTSAMLSIMPLEQSRCASINVLLSCQGLLANTFRSSLSWHACRIYIVDITDN